MCNFMYVTCNVLYYQFLKCIYVMYDVMMLKHITPIELSLCVYQKRITSCFSLLIIPIVKDTCNFRHRLNSYKVM